MYLNREAISKKLEITDPFLMIDEIQLDLDSNKAISLKKLNKEDWYYSCHLPRSPVMPATLQMEGMLQTLVLIIYNLEEHKLSRSFIVDTKAKFYSKVFKQPFINYHAELTYNKRGIFKGTVKGRYLEENICEGFFTYASPQLMNLPSNKNNI